jgi:DNA-binding NarL/FixJ family response regulator
LVVRLWAHPERAEPDEVASPKPSLRVVIADDHPMVRDGLRLALLGMPEAEVVGEAATGREVVELAERLQPDVVVMDLQLPALSGIEATRQIVHASPHIAVLVLSMYDDDGSVFAVMRAGARGYLLKGADQEEIIRAVTAVSRGEAIFGPAIATKLLGYFASTSGPRLAPAFPELTDREREVLELIAQGKSNQEITQQLMVSPKTVRNHISNIFAKLHVADRAQAIVRAREAGLGRSASPATEHIG